MPGATMREESAYPLPEDTVLPAKLLGVEVRTIEFTYKQGPRAGERSSFDIWVWEFVVTDGPYRGTKAYGETEDVLTNLPEPKGSRKLVRPWAETLLGKELRPGDEFHTDMVVGLPCKITVTHEEPRPKKSGGMFYGCPVDDVFPADKAESSMEPPF